MTNESKRDWGKFFKPEDFEVGLENRKTDWGYHLNFGDAGEDPLTRLSIDIVDTANEIIRRELEKAPRVYGTFTEDLKRAKFSGPLDWTERYHPQPSHTARLICIEEIKRDPIKLPNQVKR